MTTTPNTTEEEDLKWIREAIGHVTPAQEAILLQALTENAPGVHAIAANAAADPNVRSIVAVTTTSIKDGKHRTQQRKPRAKPSPQPAIERAHALFTGKMRDLAGTPWLETEQVEFAIDYALDHCGNSSPELETQLRLELHAPRWKPQDGPIPADPAKYTPHLALMREAHGTPDEEEVLDDDEIPF